MARKEELFITISPEGEVKVEIKGMKGPKCLDVVKLFEQKIGLITQRQLTPEYYEPTPPVRIDTQAKDSGS